MPGLLLNSPAKPLPTPTELAELDGAPLASVQPDANYIAPRPSDGCPGVNGIEEAPGFAGVNGDVKVVPGKEPAMITEFNLFSDGTVMKYVERPGFAPHCLLVDGVGRQYGVIRNPAVAELICNGVNMFHLAKVQFDAEVAAAEASKGSGAPNLIVQPHVSPKSLE